MKSLFKSFIIFLAVIAWLTTLSCKPKQFYSTGTVIKFDYGAPSEPMPFNDITAAELVSKIYIGWNLGNTLDSNNPGRSSDYPDIYQLEAGWGNPITTKANIAVLKNAGFNVIRIPVTWSKAIDKDYNIRNDWLKRVAEVVNYAIDYDMYVILNTHHDEEIFGLFNYQMEESKKAFGKIWEQIAGVFKNYSEKLIFEALNEPRTKGSSDEWTGGTLTEQINLNVYYQLFIDTVRASGGNNNKRVLMINPYGASGTATAINALRIPNDPVKDKIIVSVHAYTPYDFALNRDMKFNKWNSNNRADISPITEPIDRAYEKFVSKNIPVIMGEFGAMNKDNADARAQWAEFYVSYAKEKGIPCIWWDNGVVTGERSERFGLLDRRENKIIYPEIVATLMHASEAVIGPPVIIPSGDQSSDSLTITLPKNQYSPGYQLQHDMDTCLNGAKITTGDEFTFTYSFKSNIDINRLMVVLVDPSDAANWWTELSEWTQIGSVTADEEVSGAITLTATGTATSAESSANKFVFDADQQTGSAPVLTFSVFSIVKK